MSKRTRKPRTGLTAQEEAYCRALATNGGNGAAGIAEAMPHTRKWTPQSRARRSSKLRRKAHIRERVSELEAIMRAKANEEFAMSAEEIIHRLTLIARANLANYVTLDDDGQATIVLNKVTEAAMYGLVYVTIEDIETRRGRGKRTKIKLADRIAALTRLGQQHGMFKHETTVNGGKPIPVVLSNAEAAL